MSQWSRSLVTYFPLPGIVNDSTMLSYTQLYSDYTQLTTPPELQYFYMSYLGQTKSVDQWLGFDIFIPGVMLFDASYYAQELVHIQGDFNYDV